MYQGRLGCAKGGWAVDLPEILRKMKLNIGRKVWLGNTYILQRNWNEIISN
jgi:hypothetical protein